MQSTLKESTLEMLLSEKALLYRHEANRQIPSTTPYCMNLTAQLLGSPAPQKLVISTYFSQAGELN